MDTSQLIVISILIALVTGFIGFRIGRAIGRSQLKHLESELERLQQDSYSRTRIDNEGKWVDATLAGFFSTGEAEPGFTNYTVKAEYVHPSTGTPYSFSATFAVDDDSIYANTQIADLQPGKTTVCVLTVLNTDLFWMARPW